MENINHKTERQQKFLTLFITGFLIILLGIVILIVATALSGGSSNFGAVIFVGPFPIVFGVGPNPILISALAVILTFVSILMFLFLRKGTVKMNRE